MIDFHSHILPYIDDGSTNFDMSLDMLRIACEEGTRQICATPHFIPGEVEIEKELYDNKINGLRHLCKINNVDIDIISGLETYISPEIGKLYSDKKIWGINDNAYILIELPMEHFPIYTENVFYELRLQGAVPIIAHPERNMRIIDNVELLINLVEQGALIQINSGSLAGLYGKKVKEFANYLVKRGLVHTLGSDAHNITNRIPTIKSAYEHIKSNNNELYSWIVNSQSKILNGDYIETMPFYENRKKRSIFNFFKSK